MTGPEAEQAARYWQGYARAMARRPPPLYSREDWQAEALLGLADAISTLEPGAPLPRQAAYIKLAVGRHLAQARQAVNRPPPGGDLPRATLATAASLDEPRDLGDGDLGTRHDTVPSPASPDPTESCAGSVLVGHLADAAAAMSPAYRQALGFLLRGFSPAEVAAATGQTEGAVSNRRMRVRQKLAAALELA